MNKYLVEILKEVNTIIIPNLGALTITNAEKNEVMFMPFLKHDDGKLSSYIAEHDNMSDNEAKNLIAKFVREINTQLDKGESYDMFQFGSFSKSTDGDVEFIPWGTKNDSEETTTEAPVIAPIENNSEEEPVEETTTEVAEADSTQESTPETIPTTTENTKSEDIVSEEPEVENETTEIPTIAPTPEINTPQPSIPEEKIESMDGLEVRYKETVPPSEETNESTTSNNPPKEEKKRKGAGFWIGIIALLLLISGGSYVGLNFDQLKDKLPFLGSNEATETPKEEKSAKEIMEETLGDITENNVADSTMTDDSSSEEDALTSDTNDDSDLSDVEPSTEQEGNTAQEEEEPVFTPSTTSSGNAYHAVAGAFSSEENANKFAAKLQAQGYPSHVFMHNGRHTVSVQSFASSQEAQQELSQLRSSAPGAWILHKEL